MPPLPTPTDGEHGQVVPVLSDPAPIMLELQMVLALLLSSKLATSKVASKPVLLMAKSDVNRTCIYPVDDRYSDPLATSFPESLAT